MVNKQTALVLVLFLFSLVISISFMTSLVNNDLELQKQKNQFDELQRQILSIKNMQEEDQQKMASILNTIKAVEKDINTTQELQRIQAQRISEFNKKKKK
jgi:septal ring factor EnvC (AmiA/AmiB activator)